MYQTMHILFDIYECFTTFGVTFVSFVGIVRWNQHTKHMFRTQLIDTFDTAYNQTQKLLSSKEDDKLALAEDE